MSKTFRPYDPDRQLLLPAALQEWLPEDHLAYFISDVVDQLDLSAITAHYQVEERGGPPYHPRMMVKVLLYGYRPSGPFSRRPLHLILQMCTAPVLLPLSLGSSSKTANPSPDGHLQLSFQLSTQTVKFASSTESTST